MRWEYYVVNLGGSKEDEMAGQLNELGLAGWGLVSVAKDTYGNLVAFFKRRMP